MVAETQTKERILVIGSGGIAGLYGGLLHKAGWQVDMVARSDHATIQAQGMRVDSVLGDLSFRPHAVFADVRAAGQAEWVLVAVKVLPDVDWPALIAPAVGPHTRIFMIANGLDVEQSLATAFPDNPLISCVAFVCANRLAPGHIEHTAFGHLMMGAYPQGESAHCVTLADAFQRAGIKASVSEHIGHERWKKSIWNASFNPLSVLANGADTGRMLSSPSAEKLVRAIMAEVIATARAEGHELADQLIETNLASTRAMPPYLTSMAQDYLHQRPIELEALVGRVVYYADRHGLAVPHLRTVYDVLKMRGD